MGKSGNSFNNRASKKFSMKPYIIEQADEKDIFKTLDGFEQDAAEIETILEQIALNIIDSKGKYPVYISNMFHNVSSSKYIYLYCKKFKDDFKEDERSSMAMRHLISVGYIETLKGTYSPEDNDLRIDYLLRAYKLISKKIINQIKRYRLPGDDTIKLGIYLFAPIEKNQLLHAVKLIDKSTVDLSKKKNIFMKVCKGNIDNLYGSLFCVDMQSPFIEYMYKKFMKSKSKKRYKLLRGYARAFKRTKRKNFSLRSDKFKEKNKKVIKKLNKKDAGFIKAFSDKKGNKQNPYGSNRDSKRTIKLSG
jgi:hypothetical protein